MKFNIAVEYDPELEYEDLNELIKDAIVEQMTNSLIAEMGNNYNDTIKELAKDIKSKVTEELGTYFKDMIMTEKLMDKIEGKVNQEVNLSAIRNFSKRVMKDIDSHNKELIKSEVDKSLGGIKNKLNIIFK